MSKDRTTSIDTTKGLGKTKKQVFWQTAINVETKVKNTYKWHTEWKIKGLCQKGFWIDSEKKIETLSISRNCGNFY